MFRIQIVSARTRTFRIWNYSEIKHIISLMDILRNVGYRWELNN